MSDLKPFSDRMDCTLYHKTVVDMLETRIAELEAVAEAAVELQSLYDDSVPVVGGKWDVLEDALRAAGYLGGGDE